MTTRERILDTTLRLALHEGAHNLTFQAIARTIGFSQPAMYKHFKNKDELLAEAVRYAAEKGREFLFDLELGDLSAGDELRHHIHRSLEWCVKERRSSVALIALNYFAVCLPSMAHLYEEIKVLRIARFESWIHRGVRERLWRCEDPAIAADLVHSLMMGEMTKAFIEPRKVHVKKRAEVLDHAIQALIEL